MTRKTAKCTVLGYCKNWRVLQKWLQKKTRTQSHDIKYHAHLQQQAQSHEL